MSSKYGSPEIQDIKNLHHILKLNLTFATLIISTWCALIRLNRNKGDCLFIRRRVTAPKGSHSSIFEHNTTVLLIKAQYIP
jgi:hypothetical protein